MTRLGIFGKAIATVGLLLAASAANAAITFNNTDFSFETSCSYNAGTGKTTCTVTYRAEVKTGSSYITNRWEGASLQMQSGAPTFEVTSSSVTENGNVRGGFSVFGGKADANGCDNTNPPGVCLDYGTGGTLDGGGPVINAGDVFVWTFTVVFDGEFDWTYSPNLKFLTVRYNDNAEKWQQNGGLVSLPIGVPEPGTLALMGLGLVGMGFGARRRKA